MDLCIEDFNRIADRVPLIGNFKPHGKVNSDVDKMYHRQTENAAALKKDLSHMYLLDKCFQFQQPFKLSILCNIYI